MFSRWNCTGPGPLRMPSASVKNACSVVALQTVEVCSVTPPRMSYELWSAPIQASFPLMTNVRPPRLLMVALKSTSLARPSSYVNCVANSIWMSRVSPLSWMTSPPTVCATAFGSRRSGAAMAVCGARWRMTSSTAATRPTKKTPRASLAWRCQRAISDRLYQCQTCRPPYRPEVSHAACRAQHPSAFRRPCRVLPRPAKLAPD